MTWFIRAAAPYRGMQIRVVSEQIPTHEYESKVLARAFADITGIQVVHEITGEDDVVKKLQAQMQTGLPIYDAYVNDSDFIGTHFRMGKTLVLSDYMLGEGREVTLPSSGSGRLYGPAFYQRAGWQALSVAGPAVCQPLLVPPRLVQPPGAKAGICPSATATHSACHRTGEPMRTSPNFSPCTFANWMASGSGAIWITAAWTRLWAGAFLMPGWGWPGLVIRGCPMACQWMTGVFAWTAVIR